MFYNLANTAEAERPVSAIIDANGLEWWDALELDTETGRLIKHKRDAKGRLMEDFDRGCLVQEEIKIAAPVLVLFDGQPRKPPNLSKEIHPYSWDGNKWVDLDPKDKVEKLSKGEISADPK